MRIVALTCPACAAQLKIDATCNHVVCEYCGTTFPIEREGATVTYGHATRAPYEFERGRMKAQEEQRWRQQDRDAALAAEPGRRHNEIEVAGVREDGTQRQKHGCLMALGWLFFWPAPVSVLLNRWLERKDYDAHTRRMFLTILWGIVFGWVFVPFLLSAVPSVSPEAAGRATAPLIILSYIACPFILALYLKKAGRREGEE